MLTKLAIATPRRVPISVEHGERRRVAVVGQLGDEGPGSAWPSAERPASAGLRALGGDPRRLPGQRRARRHASMQPWLGQLPWQRGPSMSITMWPSSRAGCQWTPR